jgi:arabinofuranosyltransferase
MPKLRRADLAFVAILIAFCLYAGLFIFRTSFTVAGRTYFSLFDDAMISMRYADNLAHGHGLVWNPTSPERVEGFTNPAWVFFMALFHLLPVAQAKVSLFIQLSGAAFLLVNLVFVRKIADLLSGGKTFIALAAVFLTAFYLPLNTWSLQGMEVSVLALLVSVAIYGSLRAQKENRFSPWPYWLLAAGTLVRIDLAVPLGALLIFMLWADPAHRRQHALTAIGSLVFFIALQTALRMWYYHEPLPNTYYLKMTGYPLLLRLTRGLYVLVDFLWNLNWLLFLIPAGCWLFRKQKGPLLLAWIFLAQIAYSLYVGGDAWEWWGGANRYICLAMPAFLIMAALGMERIGRWLTLELDLRGAWQRYAPYVLVALGFITLIQFNTLYSRQAIDEWLLITRPLHVGDNRKMVQSAVILDNLTTPQAKVAVPFAGVLPYFVNRECIDLLGKCDSIIAHEPMHVASGLEKYTSFYPGHQKWDYAYAIGQLQPDVVTGLWYEPEIAAPYLKAYREVEIQGFTFWLKEGSANIRWDQVPG